MKILLTKSDLQKELSITRATVKSIGFVPTMGALHEGHKSLVEQSCSENDFTVVSIFVNPTQFNNASDLEKYPRNLDSDAAMLEEIGCDLIFAPTTSEIYDLEDLYTTFIYDFEGLDTVMEGKFRPGHFNGVVQIVSKLFKLIQPNKSYFGEKDFQQLAIIHQMTERMKLNVEIIDCKIIREKSGLAMSSRNERLTTEQRKNAAQISAVLFDSCNYVSQFTPHKLSKWVTEKINEVEGLSVEYFEIVDVKTLQNATDWAKVSVGCIAVFCGDVRLIDNIRYN